MPYSPIIAVNLVQCVGEDKLYQDQIYQSDGVTPQNITGWSITFKIFVYGDPSSVYITKTTGGGGIVLSNAPLGILQIRMYSADTLGLNPGEYEFFVKRSDPGNDTVLTRGLFTLQAE